MREENKNNRRKIITQKYIGMALGASKAEVKRQQNLGKQVNKQDRRKIIEATGKKTRRKIAALILAGAIGVGALALNSCTENSKDDTSPAKGVGRDSFVESLVVDLDETTINEKSPIESEIESLQNTDQVLNFLKETYANEYKEILGKTIDPSNLKISASNQSNIYKTSNGDYVSHGNSPIITENAIYSSGASIVNGGYKTDGTMYKISLNDQIIDAFMKIQEDGKTLENTKVIPGDNYSEMKDYTSVLAKLGDVTIEGFELMDLMNQLEKDPGNGYLKQCVNSSKEDLVNYMENYKNNQQLTKVQNTATIEDSGR